MQTPGAGDHRTNTEQHRVRRGRWEGACFPPHVVAWAAGVASGRPPALLTPVLCPGGARLAAQEFATAAPSLRVFSGVEDGD